MGKEIQIVGQNNRPIIKKAFNLNEGNQLEFLKPSEGNQVEVSKDLFINEIKSLSTFKDWVINYKRDENTIIPLRIDKIEKTEQGGGLEVEIDLTTITVEGVAYQVLEDGTIETFGGSNPSMIYLRKQPYGPIDVCYGYDAEGQWVHFNAVSQDGDIALTDIDEAQSASHNAKTRLLAASKEGNILKLVIVPFVENEVPSLDKAVKYIYSFTNDDVDVDKVTLVKLVVEYNETSGEVTATYVDETKEIEAGTVLPTPSAEDNGKVLGVVEGAYALVEQQGGGSETIEEIDISSLTSDNTMKDLADLCNLPDLPSDMALDRYYGVHKKVKLINSTITGYLNSGNYCVVTKYKGMYTANLSYGIIAYELDKYNDNVVLQWEYSSYQDNGATQISALRKLGIKGFVPLLGTGDRADKFLFHNGSQGTDQWITTAELKTKLGIE